MLVAAMYQKDHSLPKKMNIGSDAIIGNQCDRDSVERFEWNGHRITYLNFNERGVGLNRNNALMRADGDIVLFADDDMVYVDGYPEIVTKAFEDNPRADVIVFNLAEQGSQRKEIQKISRVGYLNFLRYGTARVAARLEAIRANGIYFNQCYGGGTERCHGEDNLFLASCLDRGLKIYAVPETVATLTNERPSSWNRGYDEKYVRDQGALYRCMSRKYWRLLCLQDAVRRHGSYSMGAGQAYKLMKEGAKGQ